MDKYEKVRTSSQSPRSPRSPGSSRFDTRPQWRQNRVCYLLESLGTLIVLRLRSLIIIALLLIIMSGVLTLKPVRTKLWWHAKPALTKYPIDTFQVYDYSDKHHLGQQRHPSTLQTNCPSRRAPPYRYSCNKTRCESLQTTLLRNHPRLPNPSDYRMGDRFGRGRKKGYDRWWKSLVEDNTRS